MAILFWAATPPHGNAGPQAQRSHGEVKITFPPGVSPDNDLFLAMFLVHLPLSMHETVGAGNHMTAAAMVKAADALWDAWGSHDPTVAADTTQRSRSPAPNSGRRGNKRSSNARSTPLPAQISNLFRTLAMACANFIITMPTRLTGVLHPVLGRKTSLPPNHFRFGSQSSKSHCHGYAFSSQCRTNFSHGRTDQWQVFGWYRAILSIVPWDQNSSPSGPLLTGADGQLSPLGA